MKRKYVRLTAGLMVGILATGSAVAEASTTAGVSSYTSNIVVSSSMPTAGASQMLVEAMNSEAPVEETAVEENEAPKVKSQYDDMAVAKVNDYVYVRSKANTDSEYVGKLYKNNVATVVDKKGDWYKIKSGHVTGYVSADYVVVGDEDAVKEAGRRVALVKTETLKVRKKASTKGKVMTLISGGDDLTVVDESKEGWVKVSTSEGKGYVSADYVELSTEYTYAESKKEEKARLAKEEEERKKAAEAAEAATRGDDSSSNNSSSNNNSSSSSSNRGSSSKSNSHSSSHYKKPSGANGQAVANYACQFVGNPYVYGGSSLTNGADCSGFVMAVYAKFGISLPHSSAALRGVGYGVSAKNIQPGDIVCYSGHVAIYIGNGAIVHASNRKTGIKISSNYNYRKVLAIRRIF